MSADATGERKNPPGKIACVLFAVAGIISIISGVVMVFLGIWTDTRWIWTGIATIVVAAIDLILCAAAAAENGWG